tara:strand:+ start:2413 stop:3039 length:627 start_codon:yes stop_codon:yes gene_type:complete
VVAGEDCLVASDYFRDHHSVSYVAVKMIEEAGAEILLSSGVSDVIMDGHKATGLFVENKSGTLAIKSKERVYIYEFAVFLRAHVPGFEEATLHVVAPLTCARGGKSIARMLLPVQVDGSQRQAEDLRPLQVQAHRDLPSRQRAQIAAATPGDHASQLVTDQRIGSVETAAGQAIDQLRRRVRRKDAVGVEEWVALRVSHDVHSTCSTP